MKRGFTLVEILVASAVFLLIALSIYQGFMAITSLVQASRARTVATLLANEQVELIRNLAYQKVGIVSGIPSGVLPHVQTFVRGGITFTATTTIRNIDDPFDGTIGGAPNDLNPADYRLVEVLIDCSVCKLSRPLAFTTTVAPKNLETSTGNGALFIQVLNASGQPVAGADVHIANQQINPAIVIDDLTNNSGLLQLVDVPPGNFAYEITVSKSGYSSNQTYPPGAVDNPNPVNPHPTVLAGQVTQITLSIDLVSQLNFSAITPSCAAVSGAGFNLRGGKLLGTNPDVLNYNQDHTLDGSGRKTVANLVWDTYGLTMNGTTYDLAGSVPLSPFSLSPGVTQAVSLVLAPRNPNALLVTVKDGGSGLPLADAAVTLERGSYRQTLLTDRGFFRQTDWSGGGGQADFSDATRFYSADGNIDNNGFLGQLKLRWVFDHYVSSGTLTSSTFDTGSSTASTFYNLSWNPGTQATSTGGDSVKLQIATTNDNATSTWNYLGPDGTAGTFYNVPGSNISAIHNGDRFLRYRVYLATADTNATPSLSDISVTYGSGCLPFGEVFFNGLTGASDYDLSVAKAGYQTYHNDTLALINSWQTAEVLLSPQ